MHNKKLKNTITSIITLWLFWDKHHLKNNVLKHLGKNLQKLIVAVSQKLRIAQKKLLMRKMSVGSIPIYLAYWATIEESWILGAQYVPFGRLRRLNAIWCSIQIYAHLYFQHILPQPTRPMPFTKRPYQDHEYLLWYLCYGKKLNDKINILNKLLIISFKQ